MITIRRSGERGHFDHGWLQTWHTFSFGSYIDKDHMGYRSLRVMNEDWVQPGSGFGEHGHRDMEILTVLLEGELEHRDSLGNGSVLRPGQVQRMTAGRGIRHSEFNPSQDSVTHLYQIWLIPNRVGLEPSWEERSFDDVEAGRGWRVVASLDGRDGSLRIHQDAVVSMAKLNEGEFVDAGVASGRGAWLQVLRGDVRLGGEVLAAGDGVAFSAEPEAIVHADRPAELLLFDLGSS